MLFKNFFKKVSTGFQEIDHYNTLIENLKRTNGKKIVFYSEKDIYYRYFEGFIDFILKNSELDIYYITSDANDPILRPKNPRIKPFYLKNLLVNAIKNLDNAVLVMTTPDLDKLYLKRSGFSVNHVYVFHGIGSMHLQYNKGAFDAYDTIFCIGPYDFREFEAWSKKYGIPGKELVKCGYPRIEKIYADYIQQNNHNIVDDKRRKKILIAPSWHDNNILEFCIGELIEVFKNTGYDVVIRPHPEYIKRKPRNIEKISTDLLKTSNISMELDLMSEASLLDADILVTDWSAISFEYAFGTERPVLFINTPCKIFNPDYQELGLEPIEFSTRNEIGIPINFEDIKNIDSIIEKTFTEYNDYQKRIIAVRQSLIYNWLTSSRAGGEFLINHCK
jgi:YidC/Oxa1 family membrane protein insertase